MMMFSGFEALFPKKQEFVSEIFARHVVARVD